MSSKQAWAILVITHPAKPEQRIEILTTPFQIGRGEEDNDFAFPEEERQVSRRHAQLVFEPQRILLTDLDSNNGTFINGQPLEPGKSCPLAYGVTFSIADYILYLEEAPAPPSRQTGETDAELFGDQPIFVVSTESPPPPRPPTPEPLPLSEYGRLFGVSSPCRYLQYLPPIYHTHYRNENFLDLFLQALEVILTSLEQKVDNFDLYLDPKTTLAFFLDQLAVWVDLTLDERWSEKKRRALLANAGFLCQWRGTKKGLSKHIELYTDLIPEIEDTGTQPYHHFTVRLSVPPGHPNFHEATVKRIIEENKPAHTTFTLEIL